MESFIYRRNIYDGNYIQIPSRKLINFSYVISENERKFILKYLDSDKENRFLNLNNLTDDEIEILKNLSRFFTRMNPSKYIEYNELERIFIECIFDGNKEEGLIIYSILKNFGNGPIRFETLEKYGEDFVRFIIEHKFDYNDYIKNDSNIIVCNNGVDEQIELEKKDIDYINVYKNDIFVDVSERAKKDQKFLVLKPIDEKK